MKLASAIIAENVKRLEIAQNAIKEIRQQAAQIVAECERAEKEMEAVDMDETD